VAGKVNKGSGTVLGYSGPNTGMFYTPLKLDRNSLKLNPDGMSWTECGSAFAACCRPAR